MNNPIVRLTVSQDPDKNEVLGEITLELYPDKAPETVRNFVSLVKSGFYEGTIFHRVIKGFMIQGGGMTAAFSEKRAAAIRGEFIANGFMANDLKHTRGVISMARTSDPDSASSQFFIMHEDAPHLDAQYAGFGRVTEGMEVVDKIAGVRTGRYGWYSDVPRTPIVITKAELLSE
ncbi:MAG: peptidylprolyl isomerase [Clostridia bacterium]|nr:peptidylprolyl isomerase [Clostridia bacterium]